MRIDWTTLALQLINFAILVWLLQRFLYRPVLRVIDARRQAGDARYAEAQRMAETSKRQLADIEARKVSLAADRAAALTEAREQARQLVEARRAQAERDAKALLDGARQTLAQERQSLLAEARHVALDLAAAMARRVLAEMPASLVTEGWLERIDRHLKSLAPAERAELAGELTGGAALRVVSALPVSPGAEEGWRARLRETLGPDIGVTFETDARLISGAQLCFPHSTLSFSVESAVSALQEAGTRHDEPR